MIDLFLSNKMFEANPQNDFIPYVMLGSAKVLSQHEMYNGRFGIGAAWSRANTAAVFQYVASFVTRSLRV